MASTITAGTTSGTALNFSADTSGVLSLQGTTMGAGGLGTGNASIMKNRIINGAMVIDQRNAGASFTPDNNYTLDRWGSGNTQTSKFTVQQNAGSVTPPAGFTKYLGVTSSSAYSVATSDTFFVQQIVEGFNIADLGWGTANAKTITLSFWVRSSLTGTFGGALENVSQNRTFVFSYTISSANTWEQKSITIAGDTSGTWATDNAYGVGVRFGLGSGSTYTGTAGSWGAGNLVQPTGSVSVVGTSGATFYITGVQLEVGSSATGFEYVNYQTSLANCQRYYQTSAINVPDTNCGFFGVVYGGGSTQAYGNASFKTLMRATATVTLYDGGTAGNVLQAGIGGSAATAGNINAYGFSIVNKTSGNFTTTAGYSIIGGFTASAEL
jgi:hypothetical protein